MEILRNTWKLITFILQKTPSSKQKGVGEFLIIDFYVDYLMKYWVK